MKSTSWCLEIIVETFHNLLDTEACSLLICSLFSNISCVFQVVRLDKWSMNYEFIIICVLPAIARRGQDIGQILHCLNNK